MMENRQRIMNPLIDVQVVPNTKAQPVINLLGMTPSNGEGESDSPIDVEDSASEVGVNNGGS
ncbi:hypothetical protein F2Q68_00013328 [Brassica cretica]|uniref:Uncharacterized protein n=1 Tax=Brassica cretica TaxID=69181 RepID=A0A8S9HCP7_BRACR|nr:hypothetical protein F2Q68_00013328 [Brassica cretica]